MPYTKNTVFRYNFQEDYIKHETVALAYAPLGTHITRHIQ
jgi:hypothetical protein